MLGEFGEEFAAGSQLQDKVDTSGDFNNLKITTMIIAMTDQKDGKSEPRRA